MPPPSVRCLPSSAHCPRRRLKGAPARVFGARSPSGPLGNRRHEAFRFLAETKEPRNLSAAGFSVKLVSRVNSRPMRKLGR